MVIARREGARADVARYGCVVVVVGGAVEVEVTGMLVVLADVLVVLGGALVVELGGAVVVVVGVGGGAWVDSSTNGAEANGAEAESGVRQDRAMPWSMSVWSLMTKAEGSPPGPGTPHTGITRDGCLVWSCHASRHASTWPAGLAGVSINGLNSAPFSASRMRSPLTDPEGSCDSSEGRAR